MKKEKVQEPETVEAEKNDQGPSPGRSFQPA